MSWSIRILGNAAGLPCPEAGLYVYLMYFEANGGRGDLHLTRDRQLAMKFNTAAEAFTFWQTSPKCRPLRPDGKPNRPLTAFDVDISSDSGETNSAADALRRARS